MFCFSYFQGEFYLIRSFNDSNDYEIVDVIPFYDVKKIKQWCKCVNIKFPYEFNDCVKKLLSKIYLKWSYEYCMFYFCKHVANGDIKLYCDGQIVM